MNPRFDSINPSDVEPAENLRQSELVSRLTNQIESDLCSGGPLGGTISRAISQWLLDNNLVIKADMR